MHDDFLDILLRDFLYQLREENEKADEYHHVRETKEYKEKLCDGLSEDKKSLVGHFEKMVENKMDFLHYVMDAKLLSRAFRLGMEMQRAFDEDDL